MLAMLASAFCRYLELAALLQAVGIGVDGTDRNEFRHKSPSSLNIGRVGATPRFSLDDLSSFGQPELMRLLVHALRQKAKITYRDVAVHLRFAPGTASAVDRFRQSWDAAWSILSRHTATQRSDIRRLDC